jgi:hypothetical protein
MPSHSSARRHNCRANDPEAIERARDALGDGHGINRVAKLVGLSNGTVQRIKAGMEAS